VAIQYPGVVASPDDLLGFLGDLFERAETLTYGAGQVSMCAHMLQTAELAETAGAAPELVAAALLHDVGHFGTDYDFGFTNENHTAMQSATRDRRHEEAGARMLEPFFGPDVAVTIRLHVPAKRYLCAVDAAYDAGLSATTRHTLGLQGGPMSAEDAAAFAELPYADTAAQLRRWDDRAMIAGKPVPGFGHYKTLLQGLLNRAVS
jgi:gamma-butyrobetaine dioxygenase